MDCVGAAAAAVAGSATSKVEVIFLSMAFGFVCIGETIKNSACHLARRGRSSRRRGRVERQPVGQLSPRFINHNSSCSKIISCSCAKRHTKNCSRRIFNARKKLFLLCLSPVPLFPSDTLSNILVMPARPSSYSTGA